MDETAWNAPYIIPTIDLYNWGTDSNSTPTSTRSFAVSIKLVNPTWDVRSFYVFTQFLLQNSCYSALDRVVYLIIWQCTQYAITVGSTPISSFDLFLFKPDIDWNL